MAFKVGVTSTLKLGQTITQLHRKQAGRRVLISQERAYMRLTHVLLFLKDCLKSPPLPFWLEIPLLLGHSGPQIS